jgi:hypothetical protein
VCVCGIFDYSKGVCWSPVEKQLFLSMYAQFREFKPYYTLEVSSPFSDSVDTAGIEREGENCEMLVNVGSILLSIPSSIEEQENNEEKKELVCVGTRIQGEVRYVYERRKKQNEVPMLIVPFVPSSPLSLFISTLEISSPSLDS